ncbi:MAG: TIGR02391 family protein [Coleofasciculus sp. C2-GNP5-27]
MTNDQKELLRQLVQKVRKEHIPKQFFIYRTQGGNFIKLEDESGDNELKITQLDQDVLKNYNLLQCSGQHAGIVGAFRNPSAHRLVDPTPEEGGAFIVFVNLLLKKLEDLR